MEWQPIVNALAIAIVSGVVSGLVAYGGIAVKLEWLRSDLGRTNADAGEAKALAQEAIRVAEKALLIAERRGA
jgi:hypothetical protein